MLYNGLDPRVAKVSASTPTAGTVVVVDFVVSANAFDHDLCTRDVPRPVSETTLAFCLNRFKPRDVVYAYYGTRDTREIWEQALLLEWRNDDETNLIGSCKVMFDCDGTHKMLPLHHVAPIIYYYEEMGRCGWTGVQLQYTHTSVSSMQSDRTVTQITFREMSRESLTTVQLRRFDDQGTSLEGRAFKCVPFFGARRLCGRVVECQVSTAWPYMSSRFANISFHC